MATARPDTGRLTVRFVVDGSWRRFGSVVIAGSPLAIFRLTPRGGEVAGTIEQGDAVSASPLVDRLRDRGAIHPIVAARSPRPGEVTTVTPQLGGRAPSGRLVVDDGSQPPIDGAALRLATNSGPAAARNAGRALVSTPFVAFVDADVEPAADWLDTLIGHFDDERVGLVAPRVTGEPGSPLDLGTEPARIRAGTRVSYVPGAAIVVRVAAFDAIGGFDERLRYGEDVDFVWRLDQAGWRCRYEPASSVDHRPRPTMRQRLAQHASYGTSAAPLAIRHPGSLTPLSTNGWTASAWTLLVCGHPVVASVLTVGSAAALVRRLPDVPAKESFGLAMRGHVGAARQLAAAIRRVWWPIVVVVGLWSKRARLVAAAAVLMDVRATPTDVAYGWGVWQGMRRHRTIAPIVPKLSPWPRQPRGGYGRRT